MPTYYYVFYRCCSPPAVRNKLLKEIPTEELECEVEGYSLTPILWICVASVSLGLVVVGAIMMFREPITQWIIRRRIISGDSISYTNVVESSNDLVKILSDNECQDRFDDCLKT